MASITLDHVGKSYTPEVAVIRDLAFDIRDGEFMVFVGPSGCGCAPGASRPRDAAFFEEQELRLRTLKRLRDNGLITEEEYQQKRREVLERL
jgi:ABC-type phosphonate transport system ATPase subunit